MSWEKEGQTAWNIWSENKDARFDGETILEKYNPTQFDDKGKSTTGFNLGVQYSNGNTTVAGILVEAVTGRPVQESLSQVAPGAVIVTSRSDLEGLDYTKTDLPSDRDFGENIPTDPGYTAGGYMVKPEDMVGFSQNYISGKMFNRPEYKDYVASSVGDSALHPEVDGTPYENSLMITQLDKNDPLRESGYTHFAGHEGGTPSIATDSFTLIKVEDGKITGVGETSVNMSTRDMPKFEKLQEQIKEQKQVKYKQLDALDLAVEIPESVKKEAKALGVIISDYNKSPTESESKGEKRSSWVDRDARTNKNNLTPSGARDI